MIESDDGHVATPMQRLVAEHLRPDDAKDPFGVEQARAQLDTFYEVLDARMADREWAAGDAFSLADCAAAPALFYTRAIHRWTQPNVDRYYRALVTRPSVVRVIDEARPYREIFPPGWPADQDL